MKVIINFGEVRCIVPVGEGNIKVRDVINLAIDRYKKATSKPTNSWVVVHNLKTCRDGAILDPDDRLSDVADDREQIIASFEEHDDSSHNLNSVIGNGLHINRTSSATSDSYGTESPDVFINDNKTLCNNNSSEIDVEDINRNNIANIKIQYNDVEITRDQINSCISVPLQVRRGSEPVLNRLSPDIDVCNELDPTKRWSTAVAIDSKNNRNSSTHSLDASFEQSDDDKEKSLNSNSLSPRSIKEEGYGSEEKSEHTPSSTTSNNTFSRFSRGSGRLSMIANNLDVWAEAADRQLLKINRDNSPVKDTNELNKNLIPIPKHINYEFRESSLSSMSSEDNTKQRSSEHSVIVNLAKESGPLGIHVVPDNDDVGCGNGLLIQGIEPGGRIDRDGRLHVGDSIIEINGHSIRSVDFERAQEIFRNALQSDEITLRLIKHDNHNQTHNTSVKKPCPPPVLPKPANVMKQHEQLRLEEGMVEGEERAVQHTKVATVTPTKKLTASGSHKPAASSALVVANTRKIGKKYHIQLKKGSEGLGFSITTRDNPAGGNCPIYIKTILPKGAAVEDGRLRAGDRLLEVCGIEMTGKPQSEAVKILRTLPLGTTVDLIVSRQELDLSPSPMMPRQLPPDKSGETTSSSWNEREVLTFEIPLNDTGSAGLGVSVKGKTSTSSGQHSDLGIFVKSVIHGGAASKDGRLKTNDQLININGIPLLGMTNSQAMETLRRAMIQSEGPIANPNAITLTVARRVPHQLNSSCHQREDSLLSATSNDSCNEENLSPANDMFTNFDETCDSYRSNENTVIYRPKSDSVNRDPKNLSTNSQNPVINQSSSNTTFLKKYYLSENHDSNTIYEKSNLPRSDVIIQQDTIEGESNDKLVVNGSDVNPESAPRDSQLSLSEENADGFRRDGFGRQSMSEKRHAQLDAKNTDTYRRNKKAKEEKEKQLREKSDTRDQSMTEIESTQNSRAHMIPHDPVPNNIVIIERSASDESLTMTGFSQSHYIVTHDKKKIEAFKSSRGKVPRNQMLFSPACCCMIFGKCQSPGSCPYHSTTQTNQKKEIGPSLGMRKSSSLESLQTMMQDLQREQLEQVGAFTGPRHATVRVSRSRETNESFRAAVDRSYDAPNNSENHETMETVAEEGSESGSSVGHQTHSNTMRPSGAMSMASTQYTGTTATSSQITADDETALFKKKNSGKKKGLFKTLFKFGSKKGRSSPSKNVSVNDREPVGEPNNDQSSDQNSAQNAAQMYILEQERIQMHYKRLIEQQQKQQLLQQQSNQVSQSAQPTPPARQKSKSSIANKTPGPLHSTPTGVTSGQMQNQGLSNEAVMSRNERMQQLRAQHQRMHAERQRLYPNDGEVYESAYHNSVDRKQLDYNNSEAYVSPNYSRMCSYPLTPNFQTRRLVLPKIEPIYNDNIVRKYPNAFQRRTSSLRCPNDVKIPGTDVIHSRGNSYDIYRQAMERPGSRVGIADHNSKYSHYMNYREIQQHLHQYNQQQQQQQQQQQAVNQYRQVYGSPMNAVPQEPVRQIMRSQHQRQVSSPVSHRQERPNSNYYEYESVSAMKNAALLNQQQQQQLQKQHSIQQQNNINNNMQHSEHSSASLTRRSKKYNNGENVPTGASISVPIVRQQQSIYSTNQLKIYGSSYSNGYSSQPNQSVPIYDSFQGNTNAISNSNGYQIASKYQSLRPGSKV